jgi:hypothetical protein
MRQCHFAAQKQRGRAAYTVLERCPGLPDDRPLRFDLQRGTVSEMTEPNTALLLIAHMLATPSRR